MHLPALLRLLHRISSDDAVGSYIQVPLLRSRNRHDVRSSPATGLETGEQFPTKHELRRPHKGLRFRRPHAPVGSAWII